MVDFKTAEHVSMEQLFDEKADQQMVSEANAFRTVPRGVYTLWPTKYEAVKDGEHTFIRFKVDIRNEENVRKASASVTISPNTIRSPKGFLTNPSKLYGQLTKALGMNGDASAGDVIQTFLQQGARGYVGLTYRGPADPTTGQATWLRPANEDEETRYRSQGYTPMNVIQSFQASK